MQQEKLPDETDARRINACRIACAGFTTSELDSFGKESPQGMHLKGAIEHLVALRKSSESDVKILTELLAEIYRTIPASYTGPEASAHAKALNKVPDVLLKITGIKPSLA